ncbi:hypothetical protein [Clostridium botulinum]|uniref:hypothetical protein n=1 Tax=Clostridium botulinum TaxID=1491 RepID=UPI0007747959|nr:hypothetical protein [Clostridium botulinum]NFE93549.1 hypothetical protein [Clostridium botulinum]NFL38110.1 hypothetical protein [Clostridium botulinum]NFL64402.1 hypothetical protein [Clostridium botulinum]NFN07949.1 hypothetical protein [Clostridium botulinum]NFN24146.1 hypothetical protein [Clostridium botulinum]
MKAYFKLELKKNIISLRTLIFILIILVTFIIPYLEELKFPYPGLDGVDYFIRIHQFSYISFVGPVVAGLIYSTSIIKDKESGFINKLLEVIDIKTYFKVKLVVNALINSIVFVVSYTIFILYLIMNFGINNDVGENINNGAFIIRALIGVYQTSKISYISIILLLTEISAVAFSTFMLGITTVIGRRLTAYIVPIFYVILTGIFFEIWLLNSVIDFNVIKMFDLTENNFINNLGVIVYDLMLTLLGMGLLYKFSYKRSALYLSHEI